MGKEDPPPNLEAGAAAAREDLPEMSQPGGAQSQGAEDTRPEDATELLDTALPEASELSTYRSYTSPFCYSC